MEENKTFNTPLERPKEGTGNLREEEKRIRETLGKKAVPKTFKLGREVSFRMKSIEENLFSYLEEQDSGNYIVSGLSRSISPLDFEAFCFSLGQILYNQSYQFGNLEENSGIRKDRIQIQRGLTKPYYQGNIQTTLNELCRNAYGEEEPTTIHKKAIRGLIEELDKRPYEISFPNGDHKKLWLCRRIEEDRKGGENGKEDSGSNEEVSYCLVLHPIFSEGVSKNFAEFPQNTTRLLREATMKNNTRTKDTHYKLIRILSSQDRRKPCYRYFPTLIEELNLESAYKKNRSRTEQQVISVIEDIKTMGLISSYEIRKERRRGKEFISEFVFFLNALFLPKSSKKNRKAQSPEEETEAAN